MFRRRSLMLVAAASLALATPALAARHGGDCSRSMLATVSQMLPHVTRGLDPAALSCHGLGRVYVLLTRSVGENTSQRRQMILAVFRREGLVR